MNKIIKFIALGGVVWLSAQYLSGITILGGFKWAVIAAIVLALVNTFVRPILAVLTFPVTIVTFGLFSLVITALMVMLMDKFVDHIEIASFWWALLLGLIVSSAGSLIDRMQKTDKPEPRQPIQPTQPRDKGEFTSYEEVD
jgi:putative membrane protein